MIVGLITCRDPVVAAFMHNELERVHDTQPLLHSGGAYMFTFICEQLDREGVDFVIREANARGYKYRCNIYKEQP